jgi:hypothetical protein
MSSTSARVGRSFSLVRLLSPLGRTPTCLTSLVPSVFASIMPGPPLAPGSPRSGSRPRNTSPFSSTPPWGAIDRLRLARFISLLFALRVGRRVPTRAPAPERIRGGRAPSIRRPSRAQPRRILALTPSSNLRKPPRRPPHAGGPSSLRRHRGWWRGRRRRPALGIIGGVVPQHRPQKAGQPAGQGDRGHRPAPPRRDAPGPGA